ncbi:MAG: hypothetical protein K9J13_16410 [Saprospiraceae bacterium]|nr:hypothetical protein [Saprospiraceae bacterium]
MIIQIVNNEINRLLYFFHNLRENKKRVFDIVFTLFSVYVDSPVPIAIGNEPENQCYLEKIPRVYGL